MQIVIIGGGVVGLNIALALAEQKSGDEIFLFEKEEYLGHHTSTRNSEIIHAGFAYPPGSLKSKLCVEGRDLTYKLLDRLKVAYKKSGKWIVACNEEEAEALEKTIENAKVCNATGVEKVTLEELKKAVPGIHNVVAAAFSKESGIMDAASYINALEIAIGTHPNANVIYPCEVTGIDVKKKTITTSRGEMNYDLLINSAGLWADDVYEMCTGNKRFEIVPFKGEYYLWRRGKINEIIYPVPNRFMPHHSKDETMVSSMGIHIHRSATGDLYLGPSQIKESSDHKDDYTIETPAAEFAHEVGRYLSGVNVKELEEAYAGNRPKLYEDGHPRGDFYIEREGDVIHLVGIESPALTAAPAIAKHVVALGW